eukprot:6274076-Prymnesium_polylepis.1
MRRLLGLHLARPLARGPWPAELQLVLTLQPAARRRSPRRARLTPLLPAVFPESLAVGPRRPAYRGCAEWPATRCAPRF